MKNLKKMLAVVTAISAMLASVPAFAALDLSEKDAVIDTFTCTGEDTTSPSVTASVAASAVDGGEMTFLILNDGAVVQSIQAEDILYINQHTVSTDGTSFTGVINLDRVGDNLTALPVGEYPVRIGYNSKTTGEFAIAEATLKVEEDSAGGTTITIKWGDTTGDNSIDSEDALAVLLYYVGTANKYTVSGQEATVGSDFAGYKWGDTTGDNSVDSEDALAVLLYYVGTANQYTVKGNTVTVGQTVNATIK